MNPEDKNKLYKALYDAIVGDLEPFIETEGGEVTTNPPYDKRESLMSDIFFHACRRMERILEEEAAQ